MPFKSLGDCFDYQASLKPPPPPSVLTEPVTLQLNRHPQLQLHVLNHSEQQRVGWFPGISQQLDVILQFVQLSCTHSLPLGPAASDVSAADGYLQFSTARSSKHQSAWLRLSLLLPFVCAESTITAKPNNFQESSPWFTETILYRAVAKSKMHISSVFDNLPEFHG